MSGKGSGARDPARRKCTDAEYGDRFEATFGKALDNLFIPYYPNAMEVCVTDDVIAYYRDHPPAPDIFDDDD